MKTLVSGASLSLITCTGVWHQPQMQEKWKMLPLHIENMHSNPNNDVYSECGHGELEGEAMDGLWLQPGIPLTGLFFKSNKHRIL